FGLERRDLVAGRSLRGGCAQPHANQHDRGDDREQQHAQGEHCCGDFAAVELGESVEIGVEMMQAGNLAQHPAISGMSDGPCAAGAVLLPPTNHWDFTHKRNRAERVQTVNAGDDGRVLQAGLGIQVVASRNGSALRTSSSRLMRLSATEKARSAWLMAGATTSLSRAEPAVAGGSPGSSMVPAARRMSSVVMRRRSRANS